MLNRPMRVRPITSVADMAQTIASHCSRRALSAGSTGMKWSSMKSIVTMTMSPQAMSLRHRSRARPSLPHSPAACTVSVRPGNSRVSMRLARSAAPARWLSIVTSTTRMGEAAVSATEVRFGVI